MPKYVEMDFCPRSEDEIEALATTLPDTMEALKPLAKACIEDYDAAVQAGDQEAMATAKKQHDAIVWQLNGGTMFGCLNNPDVKAMHDWLSQTPGDIPHWGQDGEFLIEAEGIRAICGYRTHLGGFHPHFSFTIVDKHRLFPSRTGYQSAYPYTFGGGTVDHYARLLFSEMCQSGLSGMEQGAFEWNREHPEWLADLPDLEAMSVAESDGQMGMAF